MAQIGLELTEVRDVILALVLVRTGLYKREHSMQTSIELTLSHTHKLFNTFEAVNVQKHRGNRINCYKRSVF